MRLDRKATSGDTVSQNLAGSIGHGFETTQLALSDARIFKVFRKMLEDINDFRTYCKHPHRLRRCLSCH